jgi:Spy/CpxP family protein refolding chaperone
MRSAVKYMFGLALVFCVASMAQAQPGGGQRGGFGGFGGFGGGSSRMGLLRIEAVQKELGLTEDQIASIRKLQEELRPMGRGGRGRGGEGGDQPRRGGRRGGGDNPDVRVDGPDRFFVQAQPGRPQISDEDRARFREEAAARAKKEREELAKILKPEQVKRLTEIYIQQAGIAALNDADVAEKLKISDDQKEKMAKVREEQQTAMRELFAGGRDGGGDREGLRAKMEESRKKTEEKILAVLSEDQKKQFEEMKGKKFDMPENARGPGRGGDRGGDRGNRGERPTN